MQNQIALDNHPIVFLQKKSINKPNNFIWLQILAIIPVNLLANWLMGSCLICDWHYLIQSIIEMAL